LNPIAHIDPTGLILLVISSFVGYGIGWMKPVQLNPYYLKNPRRDMMLTGLAGPVMNILLASILVVCYKVFPALFVESNPVGHLMFVFLLMNVILAIFNLFPIPPLDGGHILRGLLPEALAEQYEKVERFGFIIFIVLLITGILPRILGFFIDLVFLLITKI